MNPCLCPQCQQRENLTSPVSLIWKVVGILSLVHVTQSRHFTITPGCTDDDGVGLPGSLLGIRPPTGRNHGGSEKRVGKFPSDRIDQPWEGEQKAVRQEPWRPAKVLEASRRGEPDPGSQRTCSISPRAGRGQGKGTGERRGAFSKWGCLASTSKKIRNSQGTMHCPFWLTL